MKRLMLLLCLVLLTGCSRKEGAGESFEDVVGQPRTQYSSDTEAHPLPEEAPVQEGTAPEGAGTGTTSPAEEAPAPPQYRMAKLAEREDDKKKTIALAVEFTDPGYYCPVSGDSIMLVNKQTGKEVCPFGYSGDDQHKAVYLGWLCREEDCPQKDRYSYYTYPYLTDCCRYTIILETSDLSLKADDIRVRFGRLIYQEGEGPFEYAPVGRLDCDFNTDAGQLRKAPALCHGQDLIRIGEDFFLLDAYGCRQEDTRSFRRISLLPLTGGGPDISLISDNTALSMSGSGLQVPEGCRIFRELEEERAEDGSYILDIGIETKDGSLLPAEAASAGIRACPVFAGEDGQSCYIN